MNVERVENMCGGKGHITIKHILGEKEMNGKCRLYAEVVAEPGCSLVIMCITEKVRHIISYRVRATTMTMERCVR